MAMGTETTRNQHPHPASRRTTVLLAERDPDILQHVTHLLEQECEVLGSVPDAEALVRECERLGPEVVILGFSLGGLSGLEVAHRLLRMGHPARIVFLTVHEEPEFIRAAFAAGAAAYVVKSRLTSDLVSALHAALAGRVFVSPSLQHA